MRIGIGITGWRRPDYFKSVAAALSKCDGVEKARIVVSLDGGHPKAQEEMEETARNLFGESATVFRHPGNLGCAGNVGFCVSEVFKLPVDACVMLEDDTVPSVDFLDYMTTMLSSYDNDPNIWSVSGYQRILGGVRQRHSFTSWGWAIWRRCWNEIGINWFGTRSRPGSGDLGRLNGADFLAAVEITNRGSWAWPMNRFWRRDRKEIAPCVSRIQNIGAEKGMFCRDAKWHAQNQKSECFFAKGLRPWMHRSEMAVIQSLVTPSDKVLEFGCGDSTGWLCELAAHVHSIEYRKDELEYVKKMELQNATIYERELETDYVATPSQLDEEFDICLIDGRKRIDCVLEAASVMKKGAWLFFHDWFPEERSRYRNRIDEISPLFVLKEELCIRDTEQTLAVFQRTD